MPREYSPHDYAAYQAQGVNVLVPRDNTKLTFSICWRLLTQYPQAIWERCYVHRLPFKEALGTLNHWLPEADALLAQNLAQIDIIHVYDAPWAQGWIGKILAKKYNKALVMTTYGEVAPHQDPIELIDALSYKYQGFCASVAQATDVIGSMTAYCASKLAFIGVAPEKVKRTHHIVGMEEFIEPANTAGALLDQYPMLKDKRLILFVGQLQRRKGPDLLLHVAPAILEKYPDVLLAFVGPDVGLLGELKTLAHQANIAENCLFTGAVSDAEVRQFYHQAEMFVFTTISRIECLGLTFVQAMYARCPVVASNISGVPEVIRHAENGLLFEPGNREQLTAAILQLLETPALGMRLAEQAFADITTDFSEEVALQQVEQLYLGLYEPKQ